MLIIVLILTIFNFIALVLIASDVDKIKTTSNTIERNIYNLSDLIYYGTDKNNCNHKCKNDGACRC